MPRFALAALAATVALVAAAEPDDGLAKTMFPVYAREAAEYSIAVESAPTKPLELKNEPVFEWSNPTREGLQQGVLFVWLRDGRPACVGCIFSQPEDKVRSRRVMHEFHALDAEKLVVTRPRGSLNEWKPEAGLARKPLDGAPAPAASAGARLIQMKRLAQEFSGQSQTAEERRLELRLLPAPLCRYPTAATTGVIDGAVFALVSSAGTDPEVLLVLEARDDAGVRRWDYALGRFSDRGLSVSRKDKEVWALARSETNTFNHDPQHLYSVYADKVVGIDGKVLARVKATKEMWWGKVFPAEEK